MVDKTIVVGDGHEAVARLLLDAGADPAAKGNRCARAALLFLRGGTF